MTKLYKGIIDEIESSSVVKVWIPSLSPPQAGKHEYKGKNVGGNYTLKNGRTIIRCRILTPLASGAWWTYIAAHDVSVPGTPTSIDSSDLVDFTQFPNAKPLRTSVSGCQDSASSHGGRRLAVVKPSLGQAGGIPIISTANVPPGYYPKLCPNQHVLVGFVENSIPIVMGTLHTDKENEATLG